jgi:signal transduction histidine kinase
MAEMSHTLPNALAHLASHYLRLIEYFVPAAMRADREAANQARMFLVSHSMGPILGNAVPLAVLAFNPTIRMDAIVLAATITLFWVYPFLLKRGWPYKVLVLTSVVNLNFCILWSCYFYGGVSSPTLPWLLIIPILSLFYVGGEKKLQPHLLAISAGSFILFLFVYNYMPPPPLDMPAFAVYGLGIVSTGAALAYVATMAIYYARIFDSGIALEAEVSRRRAATDQLRQAVETADRASAAKAEFLARMSHELRNPLNAVIGYSQILREDATETGDTMMVEDLDRIHGAGQYLLRLIGMILDLAKLEAGRMQFNRQPTNVAEIIDAVVAAKRHLIEHNGNAVVIDSDPTLSAVVVDAVRLQQVLEAVVENAAQHTREGTIAISVRRLGDAEKAGVSIAIADTGRGIEPEKLATIFETFTSSRDAAEGGRFGGTGLNLTVVDHLCRAMGGSIEAASRIGAGSTFTIAMPGMAESA